MRSTPTVSSFLLMVFAGATVLAAGPVRSIHLALPAQSSPVIDCTDAGVVSQPLSVRRKADGTKTLSGRFGVFYQGSVAVRFYGDKDLPIAAGARDLPVDPGRPLVLSESMLPFQPPAEARTLRLLLRGREGSFVGELARATLSK